MALTLVPRFNPRASGRACARKRSTGCALRTSLGPEPSLPRHADAEFDVVDSRHAVRIGPDGNRDSALVRAAHGPPVEIETMGVGVDLEGDPGRRRLLHHRIEIQPVGIAREQEAACRVADDREVRIVHRRQHPRGHLALAHVEPAVDRCDHEVETREHRLIEIDAAVLEDVRLHALEDPDARRAAVLASSISSACRARSSALRPPA